MYVTPYVDPSEHTVNIGGTNYHSEITETDRVSTFTGLDDYDTLFAARYGIGYPFTPLTFASCMRKQC